MLHGYKKTKTTLWDNLEFLGMNPYEQKRYCFVGDAGEGPDGPEGGAEDGVGDSYDDTISEDQFGDVDVDSYDDTISDDQFGDVEIDTYDDTISEKQFDPLGLFAPVDPDIVSYPKLKRILYPKYNPAALLQDPVQMLPKLDSLIDKDTAKELSANYISMLTEAGIEAAEEKNTGLMETIQTQLNTGLLSDYYKDPASLNKLEEAGFNTFGTGYRGEYEARAPNALSRDVYDPVTLMASGTGPRSETLSLFSQFAKENPTMTAMEALSAFNAVGSFGTLNEADLGMLGYSPNQAVGPQAAFTENVREEGFYQGLSMLGRAALGGGFGVAADMAFSGSNTSLFGSVLDGLNNATKGDTGVGIVDEVSSVYDQITDPISEAFDTAASNFGSFVDSNVNNLADFFSVNNTEAVDAVDEGQPTSQAAQAEQDAQDYAQAISGVPADPSMGLADPAFAVQGQLQPGSFFSGLTPEQVESYVNTVSTPESSRRYVERRNTPYPMQPTTSIESDPFMPVSEQTSSFFPEVDLPNNSRFFELANIYGPERAQQLLGLA